MNESKYNKLLQQLKNGNEAERLFAIADFESKYYSSNEDETKAVELIIDTLKNDNSQLIKGFILRTLFHPKSNRMLRSSENRKKASLAIYDIANTWDFTFESLVALDFIGSEYKPEWFMKTNGCGQEIEAHILELEGVQRTVKLSPSNIELLELSDGDFVEIKGMETTTACFIKDDESLLSPECIGLDSYTMDNACVEKYDFVKVRKAETQTAEKIVIRLVEDLSIFPEIRYDNFDVSEIKVNLLENPSMSKSDIIPYNHNSGLVEFVIEKTEPEGFVILDDNTDIQLIKTEIQTTVIDEAPVKNIVEVFNKIESKFMIEATCGIFEGDGRYIDTEYNFNHHELQYKLKDVIDIKKNVNLKIKHLRKAVRNNPNNTQARYELVVLYGLLKQYYNAEDEILRALRLAPDSALLHLCYADLLVTDELNNSIFNTEREYLKAIELDPNNIEYKHKLVNFYLLPVMLNSTNNSIKILKEIIDLKPNDTKAYRLLGDLFSVAHAKYKRFENYAEALNYYKKCAELEPDAREIYYSLGRTYCRLKRFKEAKKEFEIYYKDEPDFYNSADDDIQHIRMEMESEEKDNKRGCNCR